MVRITVKEAIKDKQSSYNIKRFKLGNIDIDRPVRALDAGHVTRELLSANRNRIEHVLLETSKLVKPEAVRTVMSGPPKSRLKESFGWSQWHAEFPNLLTLTFKFNPYKTFKDREELAGYLDYYYNFSDTAAMVPNVDILRNIYEGKRYSGIERVINLEDYMRYVDEAYQILDYKNKKPIFVPLSLKMDMTEVNELSAFYAKKRYLDVWVDFQGATSTDRPKLALLRRFVRRIEELGHDQDLVLYCTNVRREITANPKSDVSAASDVLASVVGANLVGINREPQRPIDTEKGALPRAPSGSLLEHKARLLDPASYYYVKVDRLGLPAEESRLMKRKDRNMLRNAIIIDGELKAQAEHFLDEQTVRPYISAKGMLSEYKGGSLLKGLFSSEDDRGSLENWY
jgi:hypothetical protein